MTHILHLVPDSTYINWFRERAATYQDTAQQYVRVKMPGSGPSTLLQTDGVQILPLYSKAYRAVQKQVSEGYYDQVIIHYLSPESARFVNGCNTQNTKVVWIFWGGDFYFLPRFWATTYGPFSLHFKQQQSRRSPQKQHWLRRLLGLPHYGDVAYCLQEKVNSCASFLNTDFEAFQSVFSHKKYDYQYFNYRSLNDIFTRNIPEIKINRRDILLGNSADPANNHYEILPLLAQQASAIGHVICPLSYGDPQYAQCIAEHGKTLLSTQFLPLNDYMPREQYNQILDRVGYGVFNHRVQQAVGNIIPLLYQGAKVFLGKDNTFYKWLINKEIHIYTIEHDLNHPEALTMPLTMEQMEHNRAVLADCFSETQIEQGYFSLLFNR
jgi:dTDP-N-acetylfucosamine:lipid II N-acetylfucosaminyltransferase